MNMRAVIDMVHGRMAHWRLALAAALIAAGGLGTAAAEPAPAPAPQTAGGPRAAELDLRVKQLPVQMKMRPKQVAAAADEEEAEGEEGEEEEAEADQPAEPAAKPRDAVASTSFKALPSSMRDLRERVMFKIRAGLQVDNAPASGDALRGGAFLPGGFTESRPWIVGDAIVGAHDILLPSLGAFFLTGFQLDTSNALAAETATVSPFDSVDSQFIAIKAGYADWGRDDRKPNATGPWLRGGRQFRHDGGALFAYFDGATVGYRGGAFDASAFVGQRVVLYVDTPRGIEFGATAAFDFKKMGNIPLKLAADFMGLQITPKQFDLVTGDFLDADPQTRSLFVVTASSEPSRKLKLDVRARLVDAGAGDGFTLGRAGARIRLAPSQNLLVLADVEQRQGGDLAYDLAAPSAVDIVNVAGALGVGLGQPVDATRVGLQIDYRRRESEIMLFGRTEQAIDTPVATDQRGWFEGGAAIAGSPIGRRGAGVWTTAQYKYRQYLNGDEFDGVGSVFGDSSTSGIEQMHEIAGDAALRSGGRKRSWRFSAGAFYRIYDVASPYRQVKNDGRGGGRADFNIWINRDLRLEVAGEAAEASPTFSREIGLMSSIRTALEARW